MTEADQLRSIQDKLKLGGKLTAAERKIVQSAQRPPQFFATLEEIAAHYGVSHTAVGKWVAQEPEGFVQTEQGYAAQDVAAARKRILAKGTKVRLCAGDIANKNAENAADGGKSITESEIFEDLETLKARKMTLECQKLATQIDILQSKYALIDDIMEQVRAVIYSTKERFKHLSAELAYEVSGKTPAEVEEVITEAVNKILNSLADEDYDKIETALRKPPEDGAIEGTRLPAARELNGRQKA